MSKNNFDVIIIGGGPAGISCALWCVDLGLGALLLEAGSSLGGQLNWTFNPIENYLGLEASNGEELAEKFRIHAESKRINYRLESAVQRIDFGDSRVVLSINEEIEFSSLVIATGVKRRKLDIPGEEKFQGRGILISGKRDIETVRNKTVVVVGGGDAAFENVKILAEKAAKIYLVHRGTEFRAREEFVDFATAHPKVEILTNSVVEKISGGRWVESIAVRDSTNGELLSLTTDAVLTRIGVVPNSQLVLAADIVLDPDHYICVNSICETSVPNFFAIGDVANPISPTVSSAVGMGSTAAKVIRSRT